MHSRHIRPAGVDELPVDLVAEQEKIVFPDDVAEPLHLFAGVEVAGGIVGVANQYRLGSRRDTFLELLYGGQSEAVLDMRPDTADDSPHRDGERHVVCVEGVGDNDFVTGTQAGQKSEKHRLGTARRDYYVFRRKVDAVLRIIADHLGAKRKAAVGRAVFEYFPVDMLKGIEPAARGSDVGLPYVEMVDLDSVALRLVGIRGELAYG